MVEDKAACHPRTFFEAIPFPVNQVLGTLAPGTRVQGMTYCVRGITVNDARSGGIGGGGDESRCSERFELEDWVNPLGLGKLVTS